MSGSSGYSGSPLYPDQDFMSEARHELMRYRHDMREIMLDPMVEDMMDLEMDMMLAAELDDMYVEGLMFSGLLSYHIGN